MNCLWLWFVLCLVPAARAVVGGAPASPPEPDSAVVFVQKHGRSARLEGVKNDKLGYYSFYGIRYAEPPLGSRRFQRPLRRMLSGEMPANRQCSPCPQPDPNYPRRMIGQEDCLCLNVFSPKMPGDETGCPVVFFIHGGNYRSGSAVSYGGQHLAQKDVIVVTAQYRLGSLGYLSTGQRDVNGNLGLFDLHTAMLWINDYIEFFGGDKSRIVLMGQGSGGSVASILTLSPQGRSATGVAALSGTPLSPGAVRSDPKRHASALANHTGCPTEPPERLVRCLRQMPVEKVILADENIKTNGNVDTIVFLDEISGRSGAGVRVEEEDDLRGLPPMVIEKPADSLSRKEKRVPMLTGVTSAETSKVVFGKYNKFLSGKLESVKDFIQKDLLGGLQSVLKQVESQIPLGTTVNEVLPLSNYYQAAFATTANAIDGLFEIVEATSDALFNFPAFSTVKSWSDNGEAYMYSFEHVGNLSKASTFLPGLALAEDGVVPKNSKVKGPSHGDELAYLFEPLDAEGKSLAAEGISSTDERARENFVSLISKFAHEASKSEKDRAGTSLFGLPELVPFSKTNKNDQFLKITDTISVEKDFRFCQMGMWGNVGDRLTGALCKNLVSDLLQGLPLNKLPGQDIVGGLLGQGQSVNENDKNENYYEFTQAPRRPPKENPVQNVPVVGGLLGGQSQGKVTQPPQRQPQPPLLGGLLGGQGQRVTPASQRPIQNAPLGGLLGGGQRRPTTVRNRVPYDF